MDATQNRHILLVDDLRSIHEDFRKILAPPAEAVDMEAEEAVLFGREKQTAVRFQLDSAFQGIEALERVRSARQAEAPYAMAFVDMRMPPGWDGVETAERLWAEDPRLQIVFCTAYSDTSWREVLRRLDVRDRLLILKKPFDAIEVYQLAHALTAKWQMTEQADLKMNQLEHAVDARTRELEQSREMFRLMAESTNASPFTLDLTRGCFTYIGPRAVADAGIAETEWKRPGVLDIVLPRDANNEVRGRFDGCEWGAFEFVAPVFVRDGLRREVRFTGTCEQVAGAKVLRGLMLDITEFRRLGRELASAQKLESVGRLAAGVAHEINTPVQFVSDNMSFLRTSMSEIAGVVEAYRELRRAVESGADAKASAQSVGEVERTADLDYILENVPLAIASSTDGLGRIATIVQSMKEFAHPDQSEMTLVDLNRAIQSTLTIAHNEYKYIAELKLELGELPPVMCFLGEMNQVVLNLVINASHAIADVATEGEPRGTITVGTRLDGEDVEISIGDTGTGIPQAVRDKVFDPFFTTKEVGKGTGQGLALAHSVVVKKHRGTLRFETECGKGTTFFIRFPIDAAASKRTEIAA